MISALPRVLSLATVVLTGTPAFAQSNPCALLTSAEAVRYIARGQPTYDQAPDVTTLGGGASALCEYPYGGQVGVWNPPNAPANLERFLKTWNADKATRHPVTGVGDRAWIMFPPPRDEYVDRPAYLVAHVGQKVVTVALFARKGAADGPMGAVCRGDQSRLKSDEKEGCRKVLADRSETQESLRPNVIELARLVVERVKAGK